MRSTTLPARRRPNARTRGAPTAGAGTFLTWALILGAGVLCAPAAQAARPNVLFISIDDLNDWIGPFNDPARGKPVISTPNLRELASRGVAFTNAHTPVPLCRPARASIMTGVYPRENRSTIAQYSNVTEEFTGITTLTRHFRRHGYLTLGAGKIYPPLRRPERHWDVFEPFERPRNQKRIPEVLLNRLAGMHRKDPFDWGAVEYEIGEMSDVRIADWAIESLSKGHDRPFFLGIGFHFPHLPWYVPRAFLERYPLESVAVPIVEEDDLDDVPPEGRRIAWWSPRTGSRDYEGSDHFKVLEAGEWKRAVQAYSAASSFVDDQVGRVLDTLAHSRHADSTIVVVFSDNGWHLGEKQRWRKMALWEESTRVPLIVSYPKVLPRGREVESPVSPGGPLSDPAGADRTTAARPCTGRAVPAPGSRRRRRGRRALCDVGVGTGQRGHPGWPVALHPLCGRGRGSLYDHARDRMEHTNLLALPHAGRHAERVAHFNRIIDRYHAGEVAGQQ